MTPKLIVDCGIEQKEKYLIFSSQIIKPKVERLFKKLIKEYLAPSAQEIEQARALEKKPFDPATYFDSTGVIYGSRIRTFRPTINLGPVTINQPAHTTPNSVQRACFNHFVLTGIIEEAEELAKENKASYFEIMVTKETGLSYQLGDKSMWRTDSLQRDVVHPTVQLYLPR